MLLYLIIFCLPVQILWCLEHRQWVPEEPYELSDNFPAAPVSTYFFYNIVNSMKLVKN